MRIKVTFMGATCDYTTNEVSLLEIEPPATVADALIKIIDNQPTIKSISKYLFISVNNTLVPRDFQLSENDEITLFFRSSGG